MPSRRLLLRGAGSLVLALLRFRRGQARPRRGVAPPPVASVAPIGSAPADTPVGPLDTEARWACITNFNTGTVMLQKAADERMPPSSLTKMMTAYLVFGMLRSGRLRLEQMLPVSEKAWRMQGSKMFVKLNSQIPVNDLIRGMLIQSGNDACIVLAEGISGSEDQFVALMNLEAKAMGLTSSNFRNVTGWPDADHYMSARDVGTVARHLIADFPEYYHFFSEKDYSYNNINQGNRNVLVDRGLADGLKTGHTDAGGFGLCASSDHGNNRIIMVVNGLPSSQARVAEGERLLGWAFANFENVRLLTRGEVLGDGPVWLGQQPTVALSAGSDLLVTVPHGWQNKVRVSLDYDAPIATPVAVGRQVGQVTITGASVDEIRIPLLANAAVARKSLPDRAVAVLAHLVGAG